MISIGHKTNLHFKYYDQKYTLLSYCTLQILRIKLPDSLQLCKIGLNLDRNCLQEHRLFCTNSNSDNLLWHLNYY